MDSAAGAGACRGRDGDANDRRHAGGRAGRVSPPAPRARPGPDARRLRDGSDDDQASGLRSLAALPGAAVDLRGPARPAGQERLGRSPPPLSPAHRPEGRGGVGVRQPVGQRQGRGVGVEGLQAPWRQRARGHRGRGGLATPPVLRRSRAHRHRGLELRRVHGQLCAHPQHELRDGHRGRAGDRLAAVRLGVHRTLHGSAGGERGGICGHRTAARCRFPARPAVAGAWRHRRQRAPPEHAATRPRAAKGG